MTEPVLKSGDGRIMATPPHFKKKKKTTWLTVLATLFGLLFLCAFVGGAGVIYVFYHFGKGLPDHTQLAAYEPEITSRVHVGDGRLLQEYARERRIFVPIEAMPDLVIKAFLSAEDKNFYRHPGIDLPSIVRAVVTNVQNLGSGRRPIGASTITQQVARYFLLSNEVSLERKAKEAILSFRIEKAFSKDAILELYLNEIYLGNRAYGVAAAAQIYFDKSLNDLTVAEAAYLAAVPKAPSRYHPVRHHDRAKARRDWVIGRMAEDQVITRQRAMAALKQPLQMAERRSVDSYQADYFAEEVRRDLVEMFGEEKLYHGGLMVRTTLEPRLQEIADHALQQGLHAYDLRYGWRGPLSTMTLTENWAEDLARLDLPTDVPWQRAVVLSAGDRLAEIGFTDKTKGRVPINVLAWARKALPRRAVGPPPARVTEVITPGDVVFVAPLTSDSFGEPVADGTFGLRQIPEINGALMALDPHTGRVLAMSGGFSFDLSKFNRATQAKRQPGSSFKPFIYLAALDEGYAPTTLVLDAPFVIDQGAGLGKWKPANYTRRFYGPSTMRLGIEKSRNLMTVRLAQTLGMEKVVEYADRFHLIKDLPQHLSMSLGAGETTLMQMTAAYGMLVNGGKEITPSLIDYIQDRHGEVIFRHDQRRCHRCQGVDYLGKPPPDIPDNRAQLTDPLSAYQMVSMLHGAVERGSGRRISVLDYHLAGKTGTTNKSRDAWFIGFSPDLVVGIFTGFDTPTPLGREESGSSVAAPIFKTFMEKALAGTRDVPFRVPNGIRLRWVDGQKGVAAKSTDPGAILEAFKPEQSPQTGTASVIEGGYGATGVAEAGQALGDGGVY